MPNNPKGNCAMPPTTGPLATLRGLPLEDRAVALALTVLVERIRSLSKADREDLFELMQALRKPNTREELEDLLKTMEEILAQVPTTLREMPLARTGAGGSSLSNWKEFVAKRIRELRSKAKLTQAELAEKAGLPQSHVSRLETAQYSATRMTLEKLASALGVPLSKLDPSAE